MATAKKKPTAKQLAARRKFAAAAKAGKFSTKKKAKKAPGKKRKATFKLNATDSKKVRTLLKEVGKIRDKYLKARKSKQGSLNL